MVQAIKLKIQELESKKESHEQVFSEYEITQHLECYARIKKIDGAIEVLNDLLTEEFLGGKEDV